MLKLIRYALAPLSCGALCLASGAAFALDASDSRVTGGQEAGECAWPGVVVVKSIPFGGGGKEFLCSGTLIHPRVVLYAGHCGVASTVIFGEHWQALKIKSFVKAGPHPSGNTGAGIPNTPNDWAYAVLEKPIKNTPVIPIAAGSELQTLIKEGAPIIHAGYSANKGAPTKVVDHYLKWANNRIARLSTGAISTSSGNGNVTACVGDSGGPMLAKTAKGGWRVIGISSSKTGSCGKPGTVNSYARVRPEMIAWIEKESGIDVTPCFDDSGKATPSWACDKFMAYAGDPTSPMGSWDEDACKAAKVVPAKDAAGIPDSGEPEPDDTDSEDSSGEGSSSSSGEDSSTGKGGSSSEEGPGEDEDEDDDGGDDSDTADKGSTGSGSGSASGDSSETKKPGKSKKKKKKKKKSKAKDEDDGSPARGCRSASASGLEFGWGLFAFLALPYLRRRS